MCSKQFLLFVALIIGVVVVNGESKDQYKIVETSNGRVRGIRNTTLLNGVPFYAFKGIPYGKAPIDDLRFKAPEPAAAWKPAVFDAFDYGSICPQFVIICNPTKQSEDCLTLNIFVPADAKVDEKMAVLFFIHGGSFRAGSGDDYFYGPDFIMEKQTILVTMNYRLGPLGFLSLNSTEYSGNMGLKDQLLALKWIHSNIEKFGGDNERITIFGQSAGASAVNYHILSDESRKYFRNAIAMSGSVGNCWTWSKENNHLEIAYEIAKKETNKSIQSYDELVAFFKEIPAEKLHWYNFVSYLWYGKEDDFFEVNFAPVIESKDAKDPFIVELPEKLYESSKIDTNVLFTVASAEMLSLLPNKSEHFMSDLNTKFNSYAHLPFQELNFTLDSDKYHNLTDEIRQFYFGNNTFDQSMLMNYYELLSDINFVWGIDQTVKNLAVASKGNTYYMWFAVDSKLNTWKKSDIIFGNMADEPGAGHGDDLCYLFRCSVAQHLYDEILQNRTDKHSKISLQTIENITKIFTNFAKFSEPSYQNDSIHGFLPVQKDHVHFLTINNDGLSMGLNPNQKSIDFWNHIKQRASEISNDVRQNEIDSGIPNQNRND